MSLKILTKAECVDCGDYEEVLNWDGELLCRNCKIESVVREYETSGVTHEDLVSAEVSALA